MKAYERLIKYTSFATGSDENSESCPSTSSQLEFGAYLVEEMKEIGISDAVIDDNGYVYGTIPASTGCEKAPIIGFIAHMDVVDSVAFSDIKPRIVEYNGGDIILNEEKNIVLSPKEYPYMAQCEGKHLIVTDGTTLLGADDKNGIAEILTMAERIINEPEIKHGTIKIAFTPDEEIGRGADKFNIDYFGADWAYTLDGGAFGEVEYETFNAASAKVSFNGISIHPGSAKDKMINASLVAMEFNALLPAMERPENTDGYQGYIMLTDMTGECEHAELSYIIRDHDSDKLNDKIAFIEKAAEKINKTYGDGTCIAKVKKAYKNMSDIIKNNWHLIENANACINELGYEVVTTPVRGGTDGCVLSFMGLPCPNLGTGGYNFHGRMEFTCIEQMDLAVEMIIKIAEKYGAMIK